MLRNRLYTQIISLIILIFILTLVLYRYPIVYPGDERNYILIDEDGNIIPSNAPIMKINDYTYRLIDDINETIVIKREMISLQGSGHKIFNTDLGIELSSTNGVRIEGVIFQDCGIGLDIKSSEYIIVKNSSFINCSKGVNISYSSLGHIYNCTFMDNSIPISIAGYSSSTYVYGNLFRGYNIGISLSNSDNIGIIGNRIVNGSIGIGIYNSADTIVSDNIISGNSKAGIVVELSSVTIPLTHGGISGNIISHNNEGIRLVRASYNVIVLNNIWKNLIGIRFEESNHNYIYLNSFRENVRDVYDIGLEDSDKYNLSINYWGDVYSEGGNFWDKYNGTDEYSGPQQDMNGSDGIYDEPYVIYDDNTDHYPLVNDISVVKPRKPPTIIVSKKSILGALDSSITLDYELYNRDPQEYGISLYILEMIYPAEWRQPIKRNFILSSPSQFGSVARSIHTKLLIPSNIQPGNYTIILKAYNIINKSISSTFNLTVIVFKPLSNVEIEYASVKRGAYRYSSDVRVDAKIINLDMRDGVLYPMLMLSGLTYSFKGHNFNVTHLSSEPVYIPAKRNINITFTFHIMSVFPGAYKLALRIYGNNRLGNASSLLSEYSFGDKYVIEVTGASYIQVGSMTLDDREYRLIYIYLSRNDIGRSLIHYYDLGETLENYGLSQGINWISRLGMGLKLMDMAFGPYSISFSRLEGLRISILYDGEKGYVIDKSPINISSSDIDLDKYICRYFIKGVKPNYMRITPGIIGIGNYSFIRITYMSSGEASLTLDLNGSKVDKASYSNWPDDFVYYDMGNKSVIVIPSGIGRLCLELNQTSSNIGRSYYRLIFESYKNGEKISEAVEEGVVDVEGVKICVDVVRGLFRVFRISKPSKFNLWDIFIGLSASIVIVALLYLYMSRRRK